MDNPRATQHSNQENLAGWPIRLGGLPAPFWPAAEGASLVENVLERLKAQPGHDACAVFVLCYDTLRMAGWRGLGGASVDRLLEAMEKQLDLSRAMLGSEPVIVHGFRGLKGFSEADGTRDFSSCMVAPVSHLERPTGLLFVSSSETHRYSREDAEAMLGLASWAAPAMEYARLYTSARRRNIQLEAVSHAVQKITVILDLEELLSQVAILIREALGHYHVHLFLSENSANTVVLRACSGQPEEPLMVNQLRRRVGEQGIIGQVAQIGEPLLCNDVAEKPLYLPDELLPDTKAGVAVPLRVGDAVLGVLDVQSDHRNVFDQDDVASLQTIAEQVVIAIQNARLFREMRRRDKALRALHEVSLEVVSASENDRVRSTIVREASELLMVSGCALALCQPGEDVIRVAAVHGLPSEYIGMTIGLGQGATGRAVTTGEPVAVNDYRSWAGQIPALHDAPYDAVISVPLRWQGQVFGALIAVDRGELRPFTDEDEWLLGMFADVASVSLANADLHAREVELNRRLGREARDRTWELFAAREELAHKAGQLQHLLASTIRVQEEERARIARDLHDGSNQLVTGALYEIQAVLESLASRAGNLVPHRLATAKQLLRTIEAENRRIISGLRPPALDAQGLVPALKWRAAQCEARAGIPFQVQVSGRVRRLPPGSELAVYRIVEEALNNVLTHGRAKTVRVDLKFRGSTLRVEMEDDGVGFDVEAVMASEPGRMGLIGMRERADSIGGRLQIRSQPGQGTRLTLEVPLAIWTSHGAGRLDRLRKSA